MYRFLPYLPLYPLLLSLGELQYPLVSLPPGSHCSQSVGTPRPLSLPHLLLETGAEAPADECNSGGEGGQGSNKIGDNGLGVIPLVTLTTTPLLQDMHAVCMPDFEKKKKKKKKKRKKDKKEKCMIAFRGTWKCVR